MNQGKESSFILWGNRIYDGMLLNFLWILTSIMGFGLTVGLATGGMYHAVRHGMKEEKRQVLTYYMAGIRKHWKQTTALWLIFLLVVLVISLVGNYGHVFFGQVAGWILPLYWIFGLEVILLMLYAFPLASNDASSFKAVIAKSFRLAHGNIIPSLEILLMFAGAFVLIIRIHLIFLYLLPCGLAWWMDHMVIEKLNHDQKMD